MSNRDRASSEIIRQFRGLPSLLSSVLKPWELAVMAAALLFCTVTMFYADMTVTGPFGVLLWDSLFDGKFLSFYANCLESGIAPEGAVYDIGIYVIFAIWNLPVWILNKLTGMSLTSVFALLWYKLLPVLYTLASVVLVRDIAAQLGISKKSADAAGVVYLLSATVVMPVFSTAQYDTITVWFILMGLKCWMRDEGTEAGSARRQGACPGDDHLQEDSLDNDRPQKACPFRMLGRSYLFWFALSLITKPMGILILFLLVVLREKKPLRIIAQLLKGCSLLLVCKLVYSFSDGYRNSAMSFQGNQLESLMSISVEGSYGAISLFILGLVIVYVAAYLYDGERKGQLAVVLGMAVWALLCLFGNMTCYWTIYLSPFLVLSVFLSGRGRDRLLLLDWIGETCLTILLILQCSWVYGGEKTYTYLLLKPLCGRILSGESQVTVAGLLRTLHLDSLTPAMMAVVAGVFLTTGIAALRSIRRDEIEEEESVVFSLAGEEYTELRCQILLRILMVFVWILLTLAALYYMIH